ncbi:MAG: CBS domain-containing protein [Proteobacteria bacterium]|jgi:signal-transduction protein with cAMP-binding, CBS, and nucleotidyltransferase domain|nr:CBS domain-containing protein [Desulfocapsa sp.]MBU3943099.1 CBS domain-containing protein [Pseudomonadota bacterium]MCG2744396.1 CBS domain-containing protein [Desulfobacteraceae bacterium]MDO8946724.1 CBS domain-containing protein [Desulfocapsaceae bacterium]MBU4028964.1 CBS domain-containing protein [Pseudomonadota bacterium]
MEADTIKIVRAKDVMRKGVVSIDGMATAKEAAAKMRSEKVSYLLIKKRHNDDAWGIVVVQDFIRGVMVPDRSPNEVNVYEIMTKPVITVPADMDIRYVARLIYRAGIRRAPVEERGEIIGMISLSSLILDNELF